MAIEMSEYFQLRRKLNLSYSETEQALSPERVESLAKGREPLTADDAHRMETFAGQKERDKKAASEAAKAEYRRTWGS